MEVRTRIAPSPTGEDVHIGNVYTALLNYAFAKKHNGQFIVRIEDTDRQRLVENSEQRILSSLSWFGLHPDESPVVGGPFASYRQSERKQLYKQYALELVTNGKAYFCFCSKQRLDQIKEEENKTGIKKRHYIHCGLLTTPTSEIEKRISDGEPFVVRLKVPENKEIRFTDIIRGEIIINTNQIDDQVLLKSDGFPTYHLAVVIDDHLMKISHVIRAEEWIPSTPKHILLYDAFGWELPIFAHTPILRNPDKSKLSKRKNPVWASWYKEEGFLPQAVLNYLALMGWSHPDEKEIFSLDEFIHLFELDDVKPVGPIFDVTKLQWMNGVYIRDVLTEKQLQSALYIFDPSLEDIDKDVFSKLITTAKTRIKTLKEFKEMVLPFLEPISFSLSDEQKKLRETLKTSLEKVSEWDIEAIGNVLFSEFIQPKTVTFKEIYKAIINTDRGLPLADTFAAIGKEKTMALLTE